MVAVLLSRRDSNADDFGPRSENHHFFSEVNDNVFDLQTNVGVNDHRRLSAAAGEELIALLSQTANEKAAPHLREWQTVQYL